MDVAHAVQVHLDQLPAAPAWLVHPQLPVGDDEAEVCTLTRGAQAPNRREAGEHDDGCDDPGADSAAHAWVRDAVESKGASQRIHRNTLIFLLAHKSELESLEAATRSYLGWKRVQATSDSLNLLRNSASRLTG